MECCDVIKHTNTHAHGRVRTHTKSRGISLSTSGGERLSSSLCEYFVTFVPFLSGFLFAVYHLPRFLWLFSCKGGVSFLL